MLLVVIDGLGKAVFDRALTEGHAPTCKRLLEDDASLSTVVSPFPSLTPVCMSTLITGTSPREHRIPSLSWFHRGEHRFVEYGSSLRATTVEGTSQAIMDVVCNLNHVHLSHDVATVFEQVEDAGLTAGAVNSLVFRGRTRHSFKYAPIGAAARRAGIFDAAYGPSQFYHGELFGDARSFVRPQIGIRAIRDKSAAHVGRWLMRTTDTDFVLLYLGEHDVVAHKAGPDQTMAAVRVADRCIEQVIEGMGGLDSFRRECALVVVADHGQTAIEEQAKIDLAQLFHDRELYRGRRTDEALTAELALCPSNRFAMVYRLNDSAPQVEWIAERALSAPGIDVAAYRDGDWVCAQRPDGRFVRARLDDQGIAVSPASGLAHDGGTWLIEGDPAALDMQTGDGEIHYGCYPDALRRLRDLLWNVNAGDVVLSATPGWEFTDIGGRHHAAGGSHGSLHEIDSLAPLLTYGLEGAVPAQHGTGRLSDVLGYIESHFHLPG